MNDEMNDELASPMVAEARSTSARSTATLLASAIAMMLVASLVVTKSRVGLEPASAAASATIEAGNVELTDDDQDQSLFDVTGLAPGRAQTQCITVTYDGTVVPAVIRFGARSQGRLAEYLSIVMHRGQGGRFGDCTGFVEDDVVYDGTLAELSATTNDHLLDVAVIDTGLAHVTFRFTVDVLDVPQAAGTSATASFVWESAQP